MSVTCSSPRAPTTSSGLSRACSRHVARLLPANNAVTRLAARLSDLAGAAVELERPQDPAHGDFATNVALQNAPNHKRAPRQFAAELADRALSLAEIERTDVAGPLTVGSARNGAYGDSVARLLQHAGHDVEREYYFNDAGRQLDLFRESVA